MYKRDMQEFKICKKTEEWGNRGGELDLKFKIGK